MIKNKNIRIIIGIVLITLIFGIMVYGYTSGEVLKSIILIAFIRFLLLLLNFFKEEIQNER